MKVTAGMVAESDKHEAELLEMVEAEAKNVSVAEQESRIMTSACSTLPSIRLCAEIALSQPRFDH